MMVPERISPRNKISQNKLNNLCLLPEEDISAAREIYYTLLIFEF